MTKTQLQKYIECNSNIDFDYNSKRYGIENMSEDDGTSKINFWEWNNTDKFYFKFLDFNDFEKNAKIEGLSVVEILKDIDDADVFQENTLKKYAQ